MALIEQWWCWVPPILESQWRPLITRAGYTVEPSSHATEGGPTRSKIHWDPSGNGWMVKNFSVENGAVYIYVARDYRCTLDDTSSLFMCLWIRDQEAKATLDHLMLILVASGGLACIFSFDIPRLYQFMSNPIGQLREQLCETGLKISEIALPTTGTTVNQNEANLRLLLQDSLCSVELTCGPSYDLDQNRSVFFVAINFAWFPFGRLVRGRLIGKLDRLLKALGGRPIKREYYDLLKHRSKRILK